jgi:subfamily B ATP-binding cassette protein MsbA
MTTLTGVFLLLLVLHAVVSVGRGHLPARVGASVIRDIRYQMYAHVQRLSLGFHSARASGAIASRVITDVATAQRAMEMGFIVTAQAFLQIGAISTIMLWYDWPWALVAFSTLPLYFITTRLIRRPMRRASRRMLESTERMAGHVHERFGMIREVQAFGAEPLEQERLWNHTEELRTHAVRHSLLAGVLLAVAEFTRYLGLAIVLLFGVYRVTKGAATVGDVTAFYLYTALLLTPFEWLTAVYGQMQSCVSAAERIFEFFDADPEIRDLPAARPLELAAAPRVRFEDVRFSYPVERPQVVLNELSFDVPGGSRVVLVGPSGAGKSTMMSLLPRFYDIQGGRVLLDERDVRDARVASLRRAIGIVPQEPVLFTGTIRQNILYGRRDATENEMLHAATAANAHDFIMEQESGYDTVVGERGVGLSGGQIQRIAIARAFLKNPKVLIMDEPTSNLDARSESQILEAIDRLAEGRTTFIVAHRLSLARSADAILVLDGGRLVERGGHDELLALDGVYADLWRRQLGEQQ